MVVLNTGISPRINVAVAPLESVQNRRRITAHCRITRANDFHAGFDRFIDIEVKKGFGGNRMRLQKALEIKRELWLMGDGGCGPR